MVDSDSSSPSASSEDVRTSKKKADKKKSKHACSDASSPSASSEDIRTSKKKADKKKTKHADRKAKKKEARRERKKGKTKKNKQHKGSSSSRSSSPSIPKKSVKKEKKRKWGNDVVQKAWVRARQKAIRKAEPEVSKDEALKKAIGESLVIFAEKVVPVDLPTETAARRDSTGSDPIVEDGPVAEAVAEAERQANDAGRAAGKPEHKIKSDILEARNAVLRVAQQAGMYKPPTPDTMLSRHMKWEKAEAKRLAAYVPSTADDRQTQLARNEADRMAARARERT